MQSRAVARKSRRAGTSAGPRSASRVLLDPDDRFEQEGQDPLAVDAGQCQGDLGLDHAELDAEVEPGARGFRARGTARCRARALRAVVSWIWPSSRTSSRTRSSSRSKTDGRQHVHAEEAEVMAGAQAGDLEPQLGQGRVRLLDDLVDACRRRDAGAAAGR